MNSLNKWNSDSTQDDVDDKITKILEEDNFSIDSNDNNNSDKESCPGLDNLLNLTLKSINTDKSPLGLDTLLGKKYYKDSKSKELKSLVSDKNKDSISSNESGTGLDSLLKLSKTNKEITSLSERDTRIYNNNNSNKLKSLLSITGKSNSSIKDNIQSNDDINKNGNKEKTNFTTSRGETLSLGQKVVFTRKGSSNLLEDGIFTRSI